MTREGCNKKRVMLVFMLLQSLLLEIRGGINLKGAFIAYQVFKSLLLLTL